MIVSKLYVYPLKSGQGIELQQAQVQTKGFVGDRLMMLVAGMVGLSLKDSFLSWQKFKSQLSEKALLSR